MALAAGSARAKRVTDPLDEKVRACLRGDDRRLTLSLGSSGSDHEGCELLSGFVDGFFFSDCEGDGGAPVVAEEEEEEEEEKDGNSTARSAGGSDVVEVAMVRDLLKPTAGDSFGRGLTADVAAAAERLAALRSDRSAFRRAVMSSLRGSGYNAGICKARWESDGTGVSAGSYEYIDVVRESPKAPSGKQQQQRYIVDVDFAAEFEIARPTAEYGRVLAELPRVYVGKPEELRLLLRLVADSAKRSLRTREMHVPPWRKGRYLRAKWLGPYRRTLNPAPSSGGGAPADAPAPPSASFLPNVRCRCVGFEAAAPQLVPPVAGTGKSRASAVVFSSYLFRV